MFQKNKEQKIKLVKVAKDNFQCPCCEYRTLLERRAFEICSICFWKDEYNCEDVDYQGGANTTSLTDAISNFLEYGACDTQSINFVRKPTRDEQKKFDIDKLLKSYKIQPVGYGTIDCITIENVIPFLYKAKSNKLEINKFTWWCFVTDENIKKFGCPHGLGGPKSKYYEGYFSEMPWEYVEFKNIVEIIDYFEKKKYLEMKDYCKCLIPAFWIQN